MSNKEYIRELINKYINNKCSSEERDALFHLIQHTEYDELLNEMITQELYKSSFEELPGEISDDLYYQISEATNQRKSRVSLPNIYKYAASFILIAVSVVYFIHFNDHTIRHTTTYGEVMEIKLSDNSWVTLNGNSSLEYKKNDFLKNSREVWLEGEAFFHVKNQENKVFIVNTKDLKVEVLGTQFNVKSRRGSTNVVLSEGKVRLNLSRLDKEIDLVPGEMAEYIEDEQIITKTQVKTEQYISWVANKLIFEQKSLLEIAQILGDNYGLGVEFDHVALQDLVFTGSTPTDDLTILFGSIEKLFGLDITEQNNKIFIKKLPEPSDRSR